MVYINFKFYGDCVYTVYIPKALYTMRTWQEELERMGT